MIRWGSAWQLRRRIFKNQNIYRLIGSIKHQVHGKIHYYSTSSANKTSESKTMLDLNTIDLLRITNYEFYEPPPKPNIT